MKRNIKLIVSCIVFIGLGIGIIGAGVNYFFNHSVSGMEQGLTGSTQNSNEANEVCYITPENPDVNTASEDTTEAVLETQQTTQTETLLGQHTVSLGTCVFQKKKIACWGDSITFGQGYSDEAQLTNGGQIMDISGWTYPDTLQYYTGMDVYNLGVSGETSYEIAAREGGLTMFVAKNVTVKAGKSVEISIVDADGNSVMLDNFNGYGGDNNQAENLVYINDQLFQLEKRNEKLYIKTYGSTQKGSVKLKKGMQVVTQAAHDVNADILVLQMGSNGGWDSYDELVAQYQAMIEKQNDRLQQNLLLITALLVLLIVALGYIYRQMKKLADARNHLQVANGQLNGLNEELRQMNSCLSSTNIELSESNQIKEEYIARFIKLCSTYINRLDAYRRMVNKKVSAGQIAELLKITRSQDALDEELEELYANFDTAFLHLFPNFVGKFNDLLQDNEHILPKKDELLNTELRIFALIRLGIEDSSQIAEFLRYSVNTIYNYRAKVRNKARGSRDDFEILVRKIR